MTGKKVDAFRSEFRASVPAGYNGIKHGLTALAIGLGAIAVLIGLLTRPLTWIELTVIPAAAIGWNFVEWIVHAHVLHKPGKGKIARLLYQRHTLTHHQFFTHEHAAFEGSRDLSIVFFPVFALPVTLVLSSPAALFAWAVLSANAGLLLLATVAAMYILFEVMHLCAHVPDNAFVRHCPLVNSMRRHHIAHHNQRLMMKHNMTFTFPLADWAMGTSDLNRGLLGMMFNGACEQHIRTDMAAHPQEWQRPDKNDG